MQSLAAKGRRGCRDRKGTEIATAGVRPEGLRILHLLVSDVRL